MRWNCLTFVTAWRRCARSRSVTRALYKCPHPFYITFVPERHTMFDEMWQEIQDMPGEIFDMDIPEIEDQDDGFNLNEYLNADYDY